MKVKNKKTGEIEKIVGYVKTGDDRMFFRFEDDKGSYKKEYNSLAELNEEWEDYEEPKGYYYVTTTGLIKNDDTPFCAIHKDRKEIGNYFETKEEAEKAVEKLKAWKRLKDKGFKLDATVGNTIFCLDIFIRDDAYEPLKDDLKIVFGGGEWAY